MDHEGSTRLARRFLKYCRRQAQRAGLDGDCTALVRWSDEEVRAHGEEDPQAPSRPRRPRTLEEKIEKLQQLVHHHGTKKEAAMEKLAALLRIQNAENAGGLLPPAVLAAEADAPVVEEINAPAPAVDAAPAFAAAAAPMDDAPALPADDAPEDEARAAALVEAHAVRERRLALHLPVSNAVGRVVRPECRRYGTQEECAWPCAWLPGIADRTKMCRPAHRPTRHGHRTPWGGGGGGAE